jgi:hypothetical protein
MGRIITLVLGLAVVAGVAYSVLNKTAVGSSANGSNGSSAEGQGPSAPKRQLDNVRNKAHDIEQKDQQHLDDVEKKAFGE